MFVGQVPPEVRAAYREAMGDVVAHYADRYAAQVPEFGFYVGADLDAMHAVFTELRGGNPEGFRRGGVVLPAPDSTRVMLIADPSVNTSRVNSVLLAHEYLHILQGDLSNQDAKETPVWIREGQAVYASKVYDGGYPVYRDEAVVRGANYGGRLRDLEDAGSDDNRRYGYPLGALAAEWLTERAGERSLTDYWRLLKEHATWEGAFASAFGMTVGEFHEAFDKHHNELVSHLLIGQARGIVRGPGSGPLQGVGVGGGNRGTNTLWFAQTRQDGTFDSKVLPHVGKIRVYAREANGAWRHVGWYGRDGGFTTDVGQATALEVEDGDVVDIQIRLPADPADLPEARIPAVRGTVLGPGGEPAARIGLWLWGGSTDNSKFVGNSPDGTFEIPHQNGTFTLRIYTLEEGVWRHFGWYGGETGFTADFAQATEIEVDGANVTGIEIRLAADPADLPTVH